MKCRKVNLKRFLSILNVNIDTLTLIFNLMINDFGLKSN